MKLAIPIWNGRVAPVFDVARRLLVLTVEDGETVARTVEELAEDYSPRRVERLVELGVDTLICGAVSKWMLTLLRARCIRTIPFVSGDVDRVIAAHGEGRLPDREFAMPGYREASWAEAAGSETAEKPDDAARW